MRRLICLLLPLGTCLVTPACADAADRVYWGTDSNNKISFANLDGSGGHDLNTTGATVNEAYGTAIDAAGGKIYWASDAGNKISFANLDGSGGAHDLNTGAANVNNPEGVAVDPLGGKVYWANNGGIPISFANLDGSGGDNLNTSGATTSSPSGIAVDPAANKVYWSDNGIPDKISFANLDGSGGGGALNLGAATIVNPYGVALDPSSGRIFWANYMGGGGGISFARADNSGVGGDLDTSGAVVNQPQGVAVDPLAGRIYWGNQEPGPGGIYFARLDGSGGGGQVNLTGADFDEPAYPSLLERPSGVGAPTVTGGSTPGSTLSCTRGSWASDHLGAFFYRVPQSFAFQWSLDGKNVAGANGATHTATSPGEYRCAVTATNAAGSSSQTSAPSSVRVTDIKEYRITPNAFVAAASGPSVVAGKRKRVKTGSKVRFVLDSAATVDFKVQQRLTGRRSKRGRCVKRTKANRQKRKCTRLVTLKGGFTRAGSQGKNGFRFTGRLKGRKLRPGRYLLVATPKAGGKSGQSRNAAFRIKRARR